MIVHRIAEVLKRIHAGVPLPVGEGAPDVHKQIIDHLRSILERKYDDSEKFGTPLYKGNPEHKLQLERYFKSGHFHKNYHTNYHALWNLFCQKQVPIPEEFHVYDIACGPYTATLSLMNFLYNCKQELLGKSFYFTFCDQGDLYLETLYRANANSHPAVSFPAEPERFAVRLSHASVTCDFLPCGYGISLRQCSKGNERRCNTSIWRDIDKTSPQAKPQGTGINLVFCSYPGTYGEPKFTNCIYRTVKGFSTKQRGYPTYIVYAHFLKIGRDEVYDVTWKEKKAQEIAKRLQEFTVRSITDNGNEKIPFDSSFYHIIEI